MTESEKLLSSLQNDFGSAQFNQRWIAQDWTYYDQVGYASASAFTFFAQPAGALDPNYPTVSKTAEQTNLANPGQIGGNECFVITSIRTSVFLAAKARQTGTGVSTQTNYSAAQRAASRLLVAIMSQGVFTFTINQKNWLQEALPFVQFPAGFGLGEVQPPVAVATDGTAVYGGTNAFVSPSPFDIDNGKRGDPFSLGQPIFLAPSTNFGCTITFPVAASPSPANIYGASDNQTAILWLGVWLVGQKVRPRG